MMTRNLRTIAEAFSIVLATAALTGACHGDYGDGELLDDSSMIGASSLEVSTTQSGVTFTLECDDPQPSDSDISCSMTLANQSGQTILVDSFISQASDDWSRMHFTGATVDLTSGGVHGCYIWEAGFHCPGDFNLAQGATARVDFTHQYSQAIGDDAWEIFGESDFTLGGQYIPLLLWEDVEAVLPTTGLWHSTDYCERLDVWYPERNFGSSHWSDVRVYDGSGTTDLGPLSDYHVFNGICNTYFPGNSTWPNSYYRFHGTRCQLRARGLPRYVRVRFEDGGVPYSAMSPKRDLGTASCP